MVLILKDIIGRGREEMEYHRTGLSPLSLFHQPFTTVRFLPPQPLPHKDSTFATPLKLRIQVSPVRLCSCLDIVPLEAPAPGYEGWGVHPRLPPLSQPLQSKKGLRGNYRRLPWMKKAPRRGDTGHPGSLSSLFCLGFRGARGGGKGTY